MRLSLCVLYSVVYDAACVWPWGVQRCMSSPSPPVQLPLLPRMEKIIPHNSTQFKGIKWSWSERERKREGEGRTSRRFLSLVLVASVSFSGSSIRVTQRNRCGFSWFSRRNLCKNHIGNSFEDLLFPIQFLVEL